MTTKNNPSNNDLLNYLVDHYETMGSLPTNYITCNQTGVSYTCFGSNLKKKVEKAGGIKDLLESFVGRGAKAKTPKADKTTGRTPAMVSIQTT